MGTNGSKHQQMLQVTDQEPKQPQSSPVQQDSPEDQKTSQINTPPSAEVGRDEHIRTQPQHIASNFHHKQTEDSADPPAPDKDLEWNSDEPRKQPAELSASNRPSEHCDWTTPADMIRHGSDQFVQDIQCDSMGNRPCHPDPGMYPNISGVEHSPPSSVCGQNSTYTATPGYGDLNQYPTNLQIDHWSNISPRDTQYHETHLLYHSGMSKAGVIPRNPQSHGLHFGQSLHSQYQWRLSDPYSQVPRMTMPCPQDNLQGPHDLRFRTPTSAYLMDQGHFGTVPNRGQGYFGPLHQIHSHRVPANGQTDYQLQPLSPYQAPQYDNFIPSRPQVPQQQQQECQQMQYQHQPWQYLDPQQHHQQHQNSDLFEEQGHHQQKIETHFQPGPPPPPPQQSRYSSGMMPPSWNEHKTEKVAQRVLKKEKHTTDGQQLDVFPHSTESKSTKAITVMGLPSSINEETLAMYFGNTNRSGGGTILEIKITNGVGCITFAEDGVAENVASKRDHKLLGTILSVKLQEFISHSESSHQRCTILVSGFGSKLDAEIIQLYFESEINSGGGESVMREEEGIIFLTFKSEKVVDSVLQRCPHVLNNQPLTVVRAHRQRSEPTEDVEKKLLVTVEVRGYDNTSPTDFITLYFENKERSGGGPTTDVHRDEKKGVMYITFENEGVAKRVATKTHSLAGKQLQVKLRKPQVMYKDKILLTEVPELDSDENFRNYMEGRTGSEVEELLYGDEEGYILVCFSEDITDFQKLTEALAIKPFKQETKEIVLKPFRIPQTSSITIHDLPDEATKDQIITYFENTRKSGGGDVEGVTLNHQEAFAVITFKNCEDAEVVTKRVRKLCSTTVKVTLNFECLGQKGGSPDAPVTKLPDPILLKDVEEYKLKHFKENKQSWERFQETMETVFARAEFDVESMSVTLNPTFNLKTPNVKAVIKTWMNIAKEKCLCAFEAIIVRRVSVSSGIWSDTECILKKYKEKVEIELFRDENESTIVITGPNAEVLAVARSVTQEVYDLQIKYERKQNETTDTLSVKSAKLRLLLTQGLLGKVKINDLDVQIRESGVVSFTGQKGDIETGKLKILQEANSLKHETIFRGFSENQMKLLKSHTVLNYLDEKIHNDSGPVSWSWEPENEGITVYYTQQQGIEDAVNFLKASLKETTQTLDQENLPLMSSKRFQDAVDQLTNKYHGRVIISPDSQRKQIIVTAVGQDAGSAEYEIRNFIDKNSIYMESYECEISKLKFLTLHCQDKLSGIKKQMEEFCVDFICENESYEVSLRVKSTKSGMRDTKDLLHGIIQRVHGYNHVLTDRPGLRAFLDSDGVLKEVEQQTRCVITVMKSAVSADSEGVIGKVEITPSYDIPFVCHYDDSKILHIVVGELVSLVSVVDVVVVEATPNLSTDSKQAWGVIQKAGEKAILEIGFLSKGGPFVEGEVFCSSAGDLKCKMLIHAVGPGHSLNQREVIKAVVMSSLEEAVKKKMKSVALPDFNTRRVTSSDDALASVVEAVNTFYRQNGNSSVTEIYLCTEDKSKYDLLWETATVIFGQDNVRLNPVGESDTTDSIHQRKRRNLGRRTDSMSLQRVRSQSELAFHYEEPAASGGLDLYKPTSEPVPRPRILLVRADMGVEEADVIVNSSNTDLNLRQGQVSKSLLKNAGQVIQQECAQKYPNGIKMGDIAVTNGGNMQCVKEIYHCILPQWNQLTGEKTFTDVLQSLLVKANNAQMKTIAIPALGTGNLGYSRDLVAKLMYETVIKFGNVTPNTTVNDVLFIVYPGDPQTIEAFESEHEKHFNVASSQEELLQYRDKQGYAEKFGNAAVSAMSMIAQGAKKMIMRGSNRKPPHEESASEGLPKVSVPKTRTLYHSLRKTSNVSLRIYTDDQSYVGKAVKMIQDKWDSKAKRKHLNEDTLKSWTQPQILELFEVENTFDVAISVDQSTGCIEVYGLSQNVAEACLNINETIRKIEKEMSEKEYAENVQKLVQWFFVEVTKEGEDNMVPYDKEVNGKLEKKYSKEKAKEFTYGGYVFNFEKLVEYPVEDEEDQVQMIRRDKIKAASSNLPDTWADMPADKDVLLKTVNNGSVEFRRVQHKFRASLGQVPGQIVRLDRIQNRTLYQQYQAKKQQMEKQNPGVDVEMTLWHGTQTSATVSISTVGFNRSYCNKEQNALGEGAYFTTNAGYAARDRYAPADSQDKRYMFMCKVLTGSYTKGQSQIRVPPPKDPNNKQIMYDSVVDDPTNPQTFVIFNDTQAYPEYLISFK